MTEKKIALNDLRIFLGTASARSMQAGESNDMWKETLSALRGYIDDVLKKEPEFTPSELRLLHYALACQIPGSNPGPAQLSIEMEKAVLALAGKVKGKIGCG